MPNKLSGRRCRECAAFRRIPKFLPKKHWGILLMVQKSDKLTSWGNGSWNPIIYDGFIHPNGGCLGFLNHQQYEPPQNLTSTRILWRILVHPVICRVPLRPHHRGGVLSGPPQCVVLGMVTQCDMGGLLLLRCQSNKKKGVQCGLLWLMVGCNRMLASIYMYTHIFFIWFMEGWLKI